MISGVRDHKSPQKNRDKDFPGDFSAVQDDAFQTETIIQFFAFHEQYAQHKGQVDQQDCE